MAGRTLGDARGFTLLEVLVAFAILAVAIVSLIELSAQGLRLLKVSGDHQRAVELADRLAMETQINADDIKPDTPLVETGEDGTLTWERRIARIQLPDEIEARATIPGKEAPGLYSVSVAVRWGQRQLLEVDTLRSPSPTSTSSTSTTPATDPNTPGQPGTQPPGTPGTTPPATSGQGAAKPGMTSTPTMR